MKDTAKLNSNIINEESPELQGANHSPCLPFCIRGYSSYSKEDLEIQLRIANLFRWALLSESERKSIANIKVIVKEEENGKGKTERLGEDMGHSAVLVVDNADRGTGDNVPEKRVR